jgi:antitoxin component YwqK of YwqJK toxin-antitoxin module
MEKIGGLIKLLATFLFCVLCVFIFWYDDFGELREDVGFFWDFFSGKEEYNGEYIAVYEDGKWEVRGYYEKNKREGLWTYYWKNGNKKMEGDFRSDRMEGLWTYYGEDGNKKMEGHFKGDKKDGKWAWYETKGNKICEGEYANGKPLNGAFHSLIPHYGAAAKKEVKRIEVYERGWKIRSTLYDIHGNKARQEEWENGSLKREIDCKKTPEDCN